MTSLRALLLIGIALVLCARATVHAQGDDGDDGEAATGAAGATEDADQDAAATTDAADTHAGDAETDAQAADDEAETDAEGDTEAETDDAGASAEQDAAEAEFEAREVAAKEKQLATQLASVKQRRLVFEKRLAAVEREREEVSYTLPWIVTGIGAAAMLVGVSAAVFEIADCPGSCPTNFWQGWSALGGSGVFTAGMLWLRVVDEERAEVDSRRYHLMDELRQLRWEREGVEQQRAGTPMHLRLRVQF